MGPKKSNFIIGFIARVSSGLDIFKVEKNLFLKLPENGDVRFVILITNFYHPYCKKTQKISQYWLW